MYAVGEGGLWRLQLARNLKTGWEKRKHWNVLRHIATHQKCNIKNEILALGSYTIHDECLLRPLKNTRVPSTIWKRRMDWACKDDQITNPLFYPYPSVLFLYKWQKNVYWLASCTNWTSSSASSGSPSALASPSSTCSSCSSPSSSPSGGVVGSLVSASPNQTQPSRYVNHFY